MTQIIPKPLIYDFQTFAYCDFSNRDLSRASFRGADLTGADFTNSKIDECNFDRATLKDAKFHGTGFTLYKVRVRYKYEYKDVDVLAKTEKEAKEIAPYIEGKWHEVNIEKTNWYELARKNNEITILSP